MSPDEIKINACYKLAGRCCDVRVLRREEVDGGYIRFQLEKISGRNPGVKRWEFADYLRFAIVCELATPNQS
jgi:hypothetical protein